MELSLLPFGPLSTSSYSIIRIGSGLPENMVSGISLIASKHGRDVPENFHSHKARKPEKDDSWGLTLEDAYGDRLKYVKVGKLYALYEDEDYKKIIDDDWVFASVWAYLAKTPGNRNVALYWH